jgi:hypothetical protein
MAERLDIYASDADKNFNKISRDLEQAWRIYTRPQDFSPYKVKKAENLLYDTRLKFFASIDMETTDEEIRVFEEVMLGLYHYDGKLVLPDSSEDAKLN